MKISMHRKRNDPYAFDFIRQCGMYIVTRSFLIDFDIQTRERTKIHISYISFFITKSSFVHVEGESNKILR